MAKTKIDGVVEAVHYTADGQVAWVRAYERRGPTYTDRVLIDRQGLISRLKARKYFVLGRRKPQWASTFETSTPLQLVQKAGQEFIVTAGSNANRDSLEGASLI